MEAELPNRSVVLLEVESSEEVDGIAESATPVQENLKVLAADLAHHLNVQSFLLAPVEDNSDAVGLPRKPHLTHLGRLWQNVSRKTKFLVSSLCVILLLFWTIRAVYSYRSAANTVSASAMPLNAAQYPGYLFSHADAHSGRFGKSLCVATRFECTDFFPTDHG